MSRMARPVLVLVLVCGFIRASESACLSGYDAESCGSGTSGSAGSFIDGSLVGTPAGSPVWNVHQELGTCSKVEQGYGQALAFKRMSCFGSTLTAHLYSDSECTQPLRCLPLAFPGRKARVTRVP